MPNPSSNRSLTLTRADAGLSLLLGLASSAAYIRTLYPTVLPSDGAEYQALGFLLGIAHTTGYAIYLPLAKLATFLPIGNIAYRVNLLSALMGGLTVALVYLLGVLAVRSRWGAALAALSLALGATFWSQSVIAEVYTAASAFLAAVLVLALCWYRTRQPAYLFWAGLLGGLSLGVHGSVGLAAPAVALLLLISRPKPLKDLLPALAGAVLGAVLMTAAFLAIDANPAPYNIYDAAYRPAISAWDLSAADLATPLQRFDFIITAVQWRPAMFSDPLRVMAEKALLYATTLPKDYAWPVLALMAVGLIALFIHDWRLGLFALLGVLVHNFYTFNYEIGDNYVFYIPGYVYTALLATAGTAGILRLLARIPGRIGQYAGPAVGLLLIVLAVQPFAASRLEMLQKGEAEFDFTGLPTPFATKIWYDAIRTTVSKMEPNTIAYIGWNDLYAYTYAAWIDLGRTDLRFIEPTPFSKKGGMAKSMLDFIHANIGKHPQYFQWSIDAVTASGIRLSSRDVGPTRLYQLITP